jgi:hypothetical protein
MVWLVALGLGTTAEFLALAGLLGDGGRNTARIVIIAIGLLAFCAMVVLATWMGARFFPEDDGKRDIDEAPIRFIEVAVGGHALVAVVVAFMPLAAAIWLAIQL